MLKYFVILEDDANRIAAMRQYAAILQPGIETIFFDKASEIISWLQSNIGNVVLISLDHDLPIRDPEGNVCDYGTGRQVADFLASKTPSCPVIVHSSNDHCAAGMFFELKDAKWQCSRVYPCDDLEWIRNSWINQIKVCLKPIITSPSTAPPAMSHPSED